MEKELIKKIEKSQRIIAMYILCAENEEKRRQQYFLLLRNLLDNPDASLPYCHECFTTHDLAFENNCLCRFDKTN